MPINQLKAGAALSYVLIGLSILTGLFYTPYMLRMLGQAEYGVYSLVASVIGYLTILDFGFGNAIIRYTSKLRAIGQKQEQWELFGMFFVMYCLIGLCALAGGSLLYFNVDLLFDKTLTPEQLSQAKIMMAFLIVNMAVTFPMSIFGAIITAYENFVFQRIFSICRIIINTVAFIIVLYLGYKAVALVVITTLFNFLTLGVNYLYCKLHLKIRLAFVKPNWALIKEVISYSFWIFLNSIMDKIYWGTGQFVLGSLIGPIAVAIYAIGISLQSMYMQFSFGISGVLLPRITRMVFTNASTHEVANIFIKSGRLQSLIVSLIFFGFIIFGREFINIWAGYGYEKSYYVTIIFFASLYIPMLQTTAAPVLQARNQLKFKSITYLVISLISLAAQIILSKYFGVIGCAVAVGGALLLGQGLVMNIYYEKCQSLEISRFWREIFSITWGCIVLSIATFYLYRHFNTDRNSLTIMLCWIIGYSALYLIVAYFMGMNSYEKGIVNNSLRKLLRPICARF